MKIYVVVTRDSEGGVFLKKAFTARLWAFIHIGAYYGHLQPDLVSIEELELIEDEDVA